MAPAISAAPRKTVKPTLMPMLCARSRGDFRWPNPLVPKTSATTIRKRSRLNGAYCVAPGIENIENLLVSKHDAQHCTMLCGAIKLPDNGSASCGIKHQREGANTGCGCLTRGD